jgi:energy-coupling factor transporter ATP-binding protein EcfA2
MTHPHEQQPGPQTGSGDHNRTITTGDITGNTGPIAIGWNIVQKILHVEIPIDDKSRQSLIAQVREFWVEGVLGKSLYREAWSALGLYADPKAITYAGQLASVKGEREPQPLPADVSIDRVFDDAHHRLLILGAPGGGKTTLLLELAQVLLHRAAQDKEQAIPVVFNLSSWAQQRLPLDKWLVQELRANYGVGKNLAQQWVRKNGILPLLDGLDEVAETHRAACVKAINAYCAEHGPEGIVVCSRIADYRAIGEQLALNEAVVVQPLTDTQIANYLDQAGEPLEGVRTVLAQDAELQKLVRVPLMLNIVSLAYQGERPEELRGVQPAEQRRRLFDHYVQRMLERPRKPEQLDADTPPYSHDKTRHWLSWLARRLHENSLTVFEIERMQPWWLRNWWQRGLYVLGSTVFTGAGGLILGPLFGLLLGLIFGLGLEGVFWLAPEAIIEADVSVIANRGDGLVVGLSAGLVVGLVAGPEVGLVVALLASLGQRVTSRRRSWHAWAAGLVGSGLMVLPWWALGMTVPISLPILLWWAAFNLVSGGLAAAALVRRGEVRPTDVLRWSWHAVHARWRVGLGGGLILGLGVVLGSGLGLGLLFGLGNLLIGGLLFGLISAEIQAKQQPNAGIWRSLRHAMSTWLIFEMIVGPSVGVVVGAAASLYFGGLAFVQHWVLRLLYTFSGSAPWRYARFLDYATDRILLRRVGGSYIFVHRMLLEYFASLEDTKMQR